MLVNILYRAILRDYLLERGFLNWFLFPFQGHFVLLSQKRWDNNAGNSCHLRQGPGRWNSGGEQLQGRKIEKCTAAVLVETGWKHIT